MGDLQLSKDPGRAECRGNKPFEFMFWFLLHFCVILLPFCCSLFFFRQFFLFFFISFSLEKRATTTTTTLSNHFGAPGGLERAIPYYQLPRLRGREMKTLKQIVVGTNGPPL